MDKRWWGHVALMLIGAAVTGIGLKLITVILLYPALYPAPCLGDAAIILALGGYTLVRHGYEACYHAPAPQLFMLPQEEVTQDSH